MSGHNYLSSNRVIVPFPVVSPDSFEINLLQTHLAVKVCLNNDRDANKDIAFKRFCLFIVTCS